MNTQITEDYVSFETAKLLKEKGFREITNRYYNAQYDQIRTVSDTFMMDWNDEEYMRSITMPGSVSIPTIQMAMNWLREIHNIFIQVDYIWSSKELYTYTFDIYNMKRARSIFSTPYGESFNSYEEACETAIEYCLTNLI